MQFKMTYKNIFFRNVVRALFFLFFIPGLNSMLNAQSISTGAIPSPVCAGSTLSISFTTTGSFISGNVFTAQLSNGSGSFVNAVNIGTLTGTGSGSISVTIPVNGVTDTGYRIRVSSSNPLVTGSDNGSNITVTANIPSVTIGATQTTLCPGTSVTARATPVNGGASPSYQWKKNGVDVGTDSVYYTDTLLFNNDVISCVVISDAACVTSDTAYSNFITLTTSPIDTPAVTIYTTQNDTICAGSSLTFSAIPTHGGNAPVFQWKINGQNVGGDSSQYTSTAFANNDVISCVITSNAPCVSQPTATSNNITVKVNRVDTPAVAITCNNLFICAGSLVTFTATHNGGGISPVYQWTVNNINTGGDSATFSTTTLANNDVVGCLFTSSAACANPRTAFSNNITMQVFPNDTPTISISASRNNVCAGSYDTVTAAVTNGGAHPVYKWKVNGVSFGTDSSRFIIYQFSDTSVVTCELISTSTCVSPDSVLSNNLTIRTLPSVTPTISISATLTNICVSGSSTFTATTTNAGSSPSYQWKRNGTVVGGDSATYADNALANGESVVCILTSNLYCASSNTTVSNAITITDSSVTPSISVTATQTTICTGSSIAFTATPVYGGTGPTFQWKKNGTNVGTNSATYTDNNLNNGEVISCVLTSNASCITTNNVHSNSITITDSSVTPIVRIGATETSICPGTLVVFGAYPSNGGNNPHFQWKLNGVNVGNDTTSYSSGTLSNNDVVTCVLISSVTCASNDTAVSNTLNITVAPPTIPTISINTTATAVCPGTSVTFNSTITNGGSNPAYLWKIDGNYVANNSNSFSTNSLSSTDTVKCLLVSDAQCAYPDSVLSNGINLVIYPSPQASISPSGSFAICQGDSILLVDTATSQSYLWSTTATTQGITATATGSYEVTVTSANNCTAVSQPVTVIVNALPAPVITQSVYTLISSPASSYQWYLNDTLLVGDTSQQFDFVQNGQYQVAVTDSNGCKNISGVFTVYGVGIKEIDDAAGVKIFPNPNSGSFIVEFADPANKKIEIKDVTGRVVLPRTLVNKQQPVFMRDEAPGVYFLRVIENNKAKTFKVMVIQ